MGANGRAMSVNPRQELAAFLQTCRKRLSPQQVGLPPGERRRVKGLRREEVAALAGIGITWYTWLEQGRPIQVSQATLSQLAQVLCLNETERAYLFLLASPDPTTLPTPLKLPAPAQAEPHFQDLLDALAPHPALLRDQHWDIMAWNRAEANLNPWADMAPSERNLLLYLFTHPRPRACLPQWQEYTHAILQVFRLTWSQYPPDERLTSLLERLYQTSSEFRQWWQEHSVRQHPPLELIWQQENGTQICFSIQYLTFPLYPQHFMRVLFSSPHPLS